MPNAAQDQARISGSRPVAGADADAKILESAREICVGLVRAVTTSKIFPARQESVNIRRRAACARLLDFLDRYGDFELEIKQGAFLYRDEVYNRSEDNPNKGKAEVIIGKQRNGPIGKIEMAFLDKFTTFKELYKGESENIYE